MRKLILLAICFAVASAWAQSSAPPPPQATLPSQPSSSPTSDEIIANEQRFWDLVVAGDFDSLGNLLSPDFVSVSNKILERAAFLDDIRAGSQTCPIQPVTIGNPQVKNVSSDVATIAYSATLATSCKNRDVKITASTITIWVRRDGVWRMHLRTQLLANGFAVQSH
jgi:hypothetical protein